MPMDQKHRDYLKKCNCMVRWDSSWSPAQKTDSDTFLTPTGLRIAQPKEWRPASHDEIVREMDKGGWVPLIQGENAHA